MEIKRLTPREKSYPTSKKILYASYAIFITLCALIVIGTFSGYSTSDLATVAQAFCVELSAATGFYYWKEKNANRAKYALEFVDKVAQHYGIDYAIQIANVVLKD